MTKFKKEEDGKENDQRRLGKQFCLEDKVLKLLSLPFLKD